MADVFLSYASTDSDQVQRVATSLEAAGYSVWWDRHLLPGERFQRTIERQLAEAAVVLVVWTKTSVTSEWVYSEARRGSQRTALVQVREPGLDIDDLPAPFDGRHCPYVDDHEGVLRAVAALAGSRYGAHDQAAGARVSTVTLVHSDPGGHRSFNSAAEAVVAALDLPDTVGVGVHTGTPTPYEDGWVGMDATRAARLSAAASPGQVLLSEATAALVRDDPDIRTRDLGRHDFRGLAHAVQVHQAERPGSSRTFPPIRSLGSAAGLPRPATPFLGRVDDLDEVAGALTNADAAVVTLVGAGGIGKTRLALASAERVAPHFDGGIYFVPLETVTEADGMWAAMGAGLGLPADELTAAGVTAEVGHQRLLLVLDNLEQLPDAGDVATELLAACPSVRLLATSRGPLHVHGEREIALTPMDLETDAMDLFVQQARLVRRGFEVDATNRDDVLAICRGLDCLPLALSLAAARLRLLTPRALRDRLGDVLDVADRRHPDRQRTLRATIAWSYGLLSPPDQGVFRRLSVFAGGARLEAVEHLAAELDENIDGFTALEALAEASLVEVREDEAGESRVHLLNTTRAFALEALTEVGELDAAYASMARWLSDLIEDPERFTAQSPAMWAETVRIGAELDNLRAAIEWLVGERVEAPTDDLVDIALALVTSYHRHARGADHAEALAWFIVATTWADHGPPTLTRASACLNLAWELARTDPGTSARLSGQGRRMLLALTDDQRASARGRQLELLAGELDAVAKWRSGDLAGASDDLSELLSGDMTPASRLLVLITYSTLLAARGQTEAALAMEREAADLARSVGDVTNSLLMEVNSGCSLKELGRPAEAEQVMRSAIPRMLAESPTPRHVATMAEDFAGVLLDLGKAEQAALIWGAAERVRTRFSAMMGDAQLAETAETLAEGRRQLGAEWDRLVEQGRFLDLEELLLTTVT